MGRAMIIWGDVLTGTVPAVRGGLCVALHTGCRVLRLRAQGPQRHNVDECGVEDSATNICSSRCA